MRRVPIVIRSPSGGGIHGGPFHSQNPEMWFVRTPGLKVVCPATAYDAKGLIKSAIRDNDPVLFFEHKGLYRKIKEDLPAEEYTVPIGKAKVVREGRDLSIITYGAMVWTALEAAEKLAEEGCSVEVVDLRTLVPLDRETVCASVRKTSKVLLLHEDTRTGGMAGELAATHHGKRLRISGRAHRARDGAGHAGPLQPSAGGGIPAQCGKGRREGSLAVSLLSWRWPPLVLPPITGPARPHPDRRGRWYWKTPAAIAPCSPKPNSASPRRWPISSPRDCWLRSTLERPGLLFHWSGIGARPEQPEDLVTAITTAVNALEAAEVRYGHRSLSVAAGERCLGSLNPDGALAFAGCSDGAAVTGGIRTAFQMVEPAHGLQKRGETVRSFPVQAIALGKQVTILALSGEAALPEGVNPRGLIFAPFSNEAAAAPQDARVRAAVQRVLARVK